MELNPRAAVIAELVLWIGWLRWRTANDPAAVPDPVLRRTEAINFGRTGGYDAVLLRDEAGEVVRPPLLADWPEAEFIVGNPPFIGGKDLRARLGGAYAEAMWKANGRVPPSADLVMQWWDRAAVLLTRPNTPLRRFGFVTTNSITQEFSRRVIARHLGSPADGPPPSALRAATSPVNGGGSGDAFTSAPPPFTGEVSPEATEGACPPPTCLSLIYAIPDHPWTKAGRDAAAVRIAMTVAAPGAHPGVLAEVTREAGLDTDRPVVELATVGGVVHADLTVGTNVIAVQPLKANAGVAHDGVKLHGKGFAVQRPLAELLGLGRRPGLERYVRPYRNGMDLSQRNPVAVQDKYVIDFYSLDEKTVRREYPEAWSHLHDTVRAARAEQVAKSPTKDAQAYLASWWLFGKPRPEMRPALAGLERYIVTVDTAKHRVFQFVNPEVVCDDKLVVVADDGGYTLGVLSSAIHLKWTLRVGGWLGVGNDSVYVKSRTFDPFPFPDPTPEQRAAIAALAEELDDTRKQALAEHPRLTMTGLYNLVEKLRSGAGLTPAEEADARDARARIVLHLHGQLDAAVAAAYGWPADSPPAEIVARLVALNAERAAEEADGRVRWLRPEYQVPRFAAPAGATKAKKRDPGSSPG